MDYGRTRSRAHALSLGVHTSLWATLRLGPTRLAIAVTRGVELARAPGG
jgi:hypothetical protein